MAKPRPVTGPELLDFQSRIVGRRQAVRLGVSQTAVVRRTKSGAWQRLHRGTYATFTGVPPPIELRYVRDVERAHGLPSAERQARRELDGGVRYIDNFYEAFRLCVEIDGRLTHPPEQKWRDADRDSDNLFRDGVETIRLGLRHVTSGRCLQAAKLATLFIRRGWDGEGLWPCGPDCAVNQVRTQPDGQ